eukprot:g15188.t1
MRTLGLPGLKGPPLTAAAVLGAADLLDCHRNRGEMVRADQRSERDPQDHTELQRPNGELGLGSLGLPPRGRDVAATCSNRSETGRGLPAQRASNADATGPQRPEVAAWPMIEVCCHSADLSVAEGDVWVEVELDGFVVGRTKTCAVSGSRARPRWEERIPAQSMPEHLQMVRQGSSFSESPGSNAPKLPSPAARRSGCFAFSSRAGQRSPIPCGGSAPRVSSPSPAVRSLLEERRPAPLGQAALTPSGPQASGTPSTGTHRFKDLDSARHSQISGASPASASTARASPNAPRPARSRSSLSAGSEKSPGSRLNFTEKAQRDLVELMRSKDKLRAYAERPFKDVPGRSLLAGDRLCFEDFLDALKDLLQERLTGSQIIKGQICEELHISVPADKQMQALFDKHRGSHEGVSSEDFEALLFRLLCFLRASEEVRVNFGAELRSCSEERDKRWRQEFIQKNSQKFNEVYEVQKQLGKGSFGTVYLVSHRTQVDQNKAKRARVPAVVLYHPNLAWMRFEQCYGEETEALNDAHYTGGHGVSLAVLDTSVPGNLPEHHARLPRNASFEVRVCKMISKVKAKEAKTSEAKVREEFAVLKQLDHPHERVGSTLVSQEQCKGGDLAQYVKSLEPMDAQSYEFWVGKVMQHTLSAIAYCHSKAVIHKDLKPENVMLSTTREPSPRGQCGPWRVFARSTDRSDVVSGTPPYMAPEVWQGNFSKSCDVWSAGCMLFFLLSGRLPFVAATLKERPGRSPNEKERVSKVQEICFTIVSFI